MGVKKWLYGFFIKQKVKIKTCRQACSTKIKIKNVTVKLTLKIILFNVNSRKEVHF